MTRVDATAFRSGELRLGDGNTMFYIDAGQGPVILMLHGSGPGAGGRNNFDRNWPALVAAGYRVVIPDQLGFGYSSKPEDIDYDMDMFARTTLALLRQLGIDTCAVVGNSLGGSIALQLAIENPGIFSALILMAPGGIEPQSAYFEMPAMAQMRDFYQQHVGTTVDAHALQRVLANMTYDAADALGCDLEQRRRIFQTQNARLMSTLRVPDRTRDLHRISVPVLVLWGANDALMPVRGAVTLCTHCPNCTAIVLSRCGHWVMIERTELFNATCIAFLRSPERFGP